jgi:hypothetical protein
MERRKRYSQAEQEMVIGIYRESGKTLTDFCEDEGFEVTRVERWLRRSKEGSKEAVKFVEVKQPSPLPVTDQARLGKYRLGFANGSWLEVEGAFQAGTVRELAAILREAQC